MIIYCPEICVKDVSVHLLLILSSQSPIRVLLPGVPRTSRRRWSSVLKHKFYSLIREWRGTSSCSRAHAFLTGRGRGCFIGIRQWGEGRALAGGTAELLGLQIAVPGAVSLRTARGCHLELSAVCRGSAHSPPG